MSAAAAKDIEALRQWIGQEYWPNPAGFQPDPVRPIDIARYTSALEDTQVWRARGMGNTAPPGFLEVASPNYRNYHTMSGEEFLRYLLPFENPWGPDWTPMMLVRGEHWEIGRAVVAGDVLYGTSTITDISWRDARGTRPEMLGIEFTKLYRNSSDDFLGRVVWDMVFVEHALVDARPRERAAASVPAPAPAPRRRDRRPVLPGDSVGGYSRVFDMEALVRWSAAVWDLGLPHIDPDYARRVYGLPHVIAHGPFVNASLARVVTDWMADEDRVITHHGRFRRPVVGNDCLSFSGVVAELTRNGSEPAVVIEATATNQFGEVVAESQTLCALAD